MITEQSPARLETTTESLKLTKNSKGYNWEIKILEINLTRLQEINDKMLQTYGGEVSDD